jgi:DNA modification methylase
VKNQSAKLTLKLELGNTYELVQQQPTASVGAIVTDPPYGLGYNRPEWAWDVFPPEDFWVELRRVVEVGGNLTFLISPHVAHARVDAVIRAGWKVMEVGAWVYGNGRPVNVTRPKRCFDLVYFMARDQKSRMYPEQARLAHISNGKPRTKHAGRLSGQHTYGARKKEYTYLPKNRHPANVACTDQAEFDLPHYNEIFAVKKVAGTERATAGNHPTMKPIDLMAQIIKLSVQDSRAVLDPFMGSGSTGKAARLLGYPFIGWEQSPDHFKNAKQAIEAL